MGAHHRGFHLHVHQKSTDAAVLCWSVTRSLWTAGKQAQHAELGRGEVELSVDGGTVPEVGLAVLRACLQAYEAEIRR